jgi:uncharacterized protein
MVKQILSVFVALFLFFVLLYGFTKVLGPIPFYISSVTTQNPNGFSVVGEGRVQIKPDKATVNLGVQSSGPAKDQVQNQMNKISGAVISALKSQGIDEKDIQTSQYTINPTYDYTSGSQKITGYSGSTNVTVTVTDIGKVNGVIDAATSAGANQVGTPQFSNTDNSTALDQARQLAIADAKKKAQVAASSAGFSLGKIINYSESEAGNPVPIPFAAGVAADSAKVSPPTQIAPGQNEVDLDVTLTYEVK